MPQARTDIGFQGGQVLALRLEEGAVDKLLEALGHDKAGRWLEVESEDETITIDLAQVVYVRRETGNRSVGF
jgi:hypothetical protein